MIIPGRRSRSTSGSTSISYFIFKAVLALAIVQGMVNDVSKTFLVIPTVDGAISSRGMLDYHEKPGRRDDESRDNLPSPFIDGGMSIARETTRRMRDRCGRYSLLKVLQQWENLQKRCRLTFRDPPINDEERERYEYIRTGNGPPSPSDIDEISIGKRSRHHFHSALSNANRNEESSESQYRNYYYEVNGDALESCCPVVFEVIAPIYGRNRSGHMVELYKDENVQQKFYEYRCQKDYLEKPCQFVDGKHRRISKCVQQYLDTYALVRSDTSATGWSMEHIRVASGCACKVDAKKANRRRKKVSSHLSQRNFDLFLSSLQRSRSGRNNNKKRDFQQFRSSIIDY